MELAKKTLLKGLYTLCVTDESYSLNWNICPSEKLKNNIQGQMNNLLPLGVLTSMEGKLQFGSTLAKDHR